MSPNFNKLTLSLIGLVFSVSACGGGYPLDPGTAGGADMAAEMADLSEEAWAARDYDPNDRYEGPEKWELDLGKYIEIDDDGDGYPDRRVLKEKSAPVSYGRYWTEAKHHIGKFETVCGPVANTNYAASTSGSPTFLDIGNRYPNKNRVSIVIWEEDRYKFSVAPENYYWGEKICVSGIVFLYDGVPNIEVSSPSQISFQ